MGGGQNVLLKQMAQLASDGVDVSVVCPSGSPLATKARAITDSVYEVRLPPVLLDHSSAPSIGNSGLAYLQATMTLWSWLDRYRPGLLYASGSRTAKTLLPAACAARLPMVWSAHNQYAPGLLDRALVSYARATICVSNAVRSQYQVTDASASKLHVIYNSVDVASYGRVDRERFRAELGASQTDILLGIVSRISPLKGHDLLFRAVIPLLERFPDLRVVVVGDSDQRGEAYVRWLHSFASDSVTGSRFTFTGWRNDVPSILRALDIVALPSLTEGLPVVLIEAQAACTAVIASRVGGIPEVILDNETGILVEPGDIGQLSDAVSRLCSSPELRSSLGEAGYRRAREVFDDALLLPRFSTLLLSVAGPR